MAVGVERIERESVRENPERNHHNFSLGGFPS